MLKDKNASDLTPELARFVERTEQVRNGQYKAWRAEIIAQAGVDAANDNLDDTVDGLDKSALSIVKQNRSSPRHKRYFAQSASHVIRLGLASEIKRIEGWPTSLKGESEQ